MDRMEKQKIFEDMKAGIRPCVLPMGVIGYAEYRKDIYNQGEPDKVAAKGTVLVSDDKSKRYTADGGIWDMSARLRFHDAYDIFDMDLGEIIIEDVNKDMLVNMKALYDAKDMTHVVFPWHYGTLLTRCQIKFGWEPLLEASAIEPRKLGKVLDRIGESTLNVLDGWSRLDDVYMIIVHDDIASTKGLIWSPGYLREYVFPWYERFFNKIHENKKKVLYITDGNYMEAMDDILDLGPDGLYCESSAVSPNEVMEAGGQDLFYLLKTDSRTMDYGSGEEIEAEVLNIKKLHERYPRIFAYRGGGSVNPDNVEMFDKLYERHLVY